MYPINILHVISKLPTVGVENQLLMALKNYDRMIEAMAEAFQFLHH